MTRTPVVDHRYEPDLVLPPGETLVEVLAERGMTQIQLAVRTGLSAKHINQITKGAAPVTPDTALLLENTTGVPARVWSNLETAYREFESRKRQAARLAEDVDWLRDLPVKELITRGWVQKGLPAADRVLGVCRFFGVANREAWNEVWQKPTAYRVSQAFTSDPGAVAAWLRIGEVKALAIPCAPFDEAGLKKLLPELRALTRETDLARSWPRLVSRCADVGVAVVVEPEIKRARINGAARWLGPDKALVQLSLRHRRHDLFWFTLFHEMGHLLLHSKKATFISEDGSHGALEQAADAFAAELLIPPQHEADLARLRTNADAVAFAHRLGIAPGIVVGRLQHDGRWTQARGSHLRQSIALPEEAKHTA